MATPMFRHRTEPLMVTNPGPTRTWRAENAQDHVQLSALLVTDIGTGRIWWEWRHGHWVIAEEPYSAAVPKRRDTNRHK